MSLQQIAGPGRSTKGIANAIECPEAKKSKPAVFIVINSPKACQSRKEAITVHSGNRLCPEDVKMHFRACEVAHN